VTIGNCVFPVAAALVWNALPQSLTAAPSAGASRRALKTHLFLRSYTDTSDTSFLNSVTWSCSALALASPNPVMLMMMMMMMMMMIMMKVQQRNYTNMQKSLIDAVMHHRVTLTSEDVTSAFVKV